MAVDEDNDLEGSEIILERVSDLRNFIVYVYMGDTSSCPSVSVLIIINHKN